MGAQTAARRPPAWVRLADEGADANTVLRVFEVEYPPVNVEELARRMGIDILPEPSGTEISGRIDVDRETLSATIRVRRDHVMWRQRFTIAHEIGHLLLNHTDGNTCYRGFAGPQEGAANRFAADLLMPLWMLEPLAIKYGPDAALLARAFQVSEGAMKIRLEVLTGIRR